MSDQFHCLICQQEVEGDENFCLGCNEYVCEKCYGTIETPQGFHHPVAHLKSEDYDEDKDE